MFGFVTANVKELDKDQLRRYNEVYCGICRRIRRQASSFARLGLSYDMAFLALLLMSLYEPEETAGNCACHLHPIRPKPWVDNPYIHYAADMNVALGYYNALDDVQDDKKATAKLAASVLGKTLPEIQARYPRQCSTIQVCMETLSRLEAENCSNPDLPAGCFGDLMAELLVYSEDIWSPILRQMGHALGRFIYLTDAAVDFRMDQKRKKYNPFLAMGTGEAWETWQNYLVLDMARCTEAFEKLPLVQDKKLLDCILYSGVWVEFERRRPRKKDAQEDKS